MMCPVDLPRTRTNLHLLEDIINCVRNGRIILLLDDDCEDAEGCLIVAAQMVTPEKLDFMERHTRAPICLALSIERAARLLTGAVGFGGEDPARFDSTESVKAEGVPPVRMSALASAQEIAAAIEVGMDLGPMPELRNIRPLAARNGGVLERAGLAEAAIDIARLAGLNASSVICSLINDEGAPLRMRELVAFANEHSLVTGTVRDLIAHRLRHDHLLEVLAEGTFQSRWGGDWKVRTYRNKADGAVRAALIKGEIDPSKPALVRLHAPRVFADILGEGTDQSHVLARSMEMISEWGAGALIMTDEIIGRNFTSKVRDEQECKDDFEKSNLKNYNLCALIMNHIGIKRLVLLTNARPFSMTFEGYGMSVVGQRVIK